MIEVKRTIDAPAQTVFDVLGDGWLYASWVVGASRIRSVDAGWPSIGTRIHHSFGSWPLVLDDTTHVTVSKPPRALTLVAKGWPVGEAVVEIEIEPLGKESCEVTMREDAISGPGRLIPKPLRQLAIHPRNTESLQRLAFLAEGRAR